MAGAVIEVKYFNTFVLKKTATQTEDTIVWNGSFGIPKDKGGYNVVTADVTSDTNWAIEESRIRGGYNNTNVDYGVRAYLVEEDPASTIRFNSLIYSGIFNSRTGINNTNVFSSADDITKSADPANASIQKLYAEDTNLIIFQEYKVSRALIDKDAIYSAEGNASVTSSNLTIGVIQPYAGKFGISRNPESFAIYGYNKYFSDKNNNVIMKLSNSGLEEISRYGMIDYFRDELNSIDIGIDEGKVRGGYDIHSDQYVVSTQNSDGSGYNTVSWDETVKGWTSFYDYKPTQMFSLRNKFYSTGKDNFYGSLKAVWGVRLYDSLYEHYSVDVNRSFFYERNYPSTVTFIFNPSASTSKNFKTISYEGMNGWQLNTLISDNTAKDYNALIPGWDIYNDTANSARSYVGGEYVIADASAKAGAASTNTTVVLANVVGVIAVGASVTGIGVAANTVVVSFNATTKTLTVNQNLGVALNAALAFYLVVNRVNYTTAFGNANPPLPRFHAGFDRKENRYVANLVNNSEASHGEIIWGNEMTGVKGYYVTGIFSTDGDYSTNVSYNNNTATDPGGEKQLFAVGSDYVNTNGY